MNIYADRGNLLMLRRRCEWRGIGFELRSSGIGEDLDPDGVDLFYMGGGQDRDQELCAVDLHERKRAALVSARTWARRRSRWDAHWPVMATTGPTVSRAPSPEM